MNKNEKEKGLTAVYVEKVWGMGESISDDQRALGKATGMEGREICVFFLGGERSGMYILAWLIKGGLWLSLETWTGGWRKGWWMR